MKSYKILSSKVVYEVLNSEVIVIDFRTGTYYALLHVAKQAWMLIEKQMPLEQIVQLISGYYKRDPGEVLVDMEQFIEQLLQDGLVEPIDGAVVSHQIEPCEWGYEPPKLLTYLDVQELLLLDPIHEVAEVGWPEKP